MVIEGGACLTLFSNFKEQVMWSDAPESTIHSWVVDSTTPQVIILENGVSKSSSTCAEYPGLAPGINLSSC